MKRLPIVSAVLVTLAVATMIALGCWQLLDRRPKKLALLHELKANPAKPPIAFPRPPIGDDLIYRKAGGFCLKPESFAIEGAGSAGFRVLARCSTGAEGPGMTVQIGTSKAVSPIYQWSGGKVSGYIGLTPTHESAILSLFERTGPAELMLVSDTPATGLSPNPKPDPEVIPNNHLAYAVQWFIFAGLAVLIYIVVLRRRRPVVATDQRR